jgi:hypothetical protein
MQPAVLVLAIVMAAAGSAAQQQSSSGLLPLAPGAYVELSDGTRRDAAQLLANHWAARDAAPGSSQPREGAGVWCCVPVWNGCASGEAWASVVNAGALSRPQQAPALSTDPTCASQPACTFPVRGAAYINLCAGGARCSSSVGPEAARVSERAALEVVGNGTDSGSLAGSRTDGNETSFAGPSSSSSQSGKAGLANGSTGAGSGTGGSVGPVSSQSPPVVAADGTAEKDSSPTIRPAPRIPPLQSPVPPPPLPSLALAILSSPAPAVQAASAPPAPLSRLSSALNTTATSLVGSAVNAAQRRVNETLQSLGRRVDVLVLPPGASTSRGRAPTAGATGWAAPLLLGAAFIVRALD